MKINYEKIKNKAIIVESRFDLHPIILSFVYDGKLSITREHIHSGDITLYDEWCNFGDDLYKTQKQVGTFVIALDETAPTGCVYGDINELTEQGYELIPLEEALEQLPNMCNLLGVTPTQSLEDVGLLSPSIFSPHKVNLDGVIRANNDGWLEVEGVLELLKKLDVIKTDESMLIDLFGLLPGDTFSIAGRMFKEITNADEYQSFINKCKNRAGLFYELINKPSIIVKQIETKDKTSCLGLR